MFTGDTDGFINAFSIGTPGNEKSVKQTSEMKGMPKSRVVIWSEAQGEIFSGNQNGKITVFNPKRGESIAVIDAHSGPITQMRWFEKSRYLFTASKDKTL